MISNEAAECGARILIEDGRFGVPWEDASDDDRTDAMSRARAALEAAAPFIQAEALEEAADAWGYAAAAVWLRARAAEMRQG